VSKSAWETKHVTVSRARFKLLPLRYNQTTIVKTSLAHVVMTFTAVMGFSSEASRALNKLTSCP